MKTPLRIRVCDRADKLAAMNTRVRNRGDAPPRTKTIVFHVTPDELVRLDLLARQLRVKRDRAVRVGLELLFREQQRAETEGRAA